MISEEEKAKKLHKLLDEITPINLDDSCAEDLLTEECKDCKQSSKERIAC